MIFDYSNTTQALHTIAQRLYTEFGGQIPSNWSLKDNYSFDVQVLDQSFEITVRVPDYYKFIESGRRAGAKMPPREAMLRFIEKRHITPKALKNGKVPSLNQLAFLIGRKISRDGIPARKMIDNVISKVDDLDTILSDALTKDIQYSVQKILDEIKE